MVNDQYFLYQAFKQAQKAFDENEVPVGALLVDQLGSIIARGYNLVEKKQSQLAHAELLVLAKASKKYNSWRLLNTTLYVTLQPCAMCLAAIYLSRISRIVYGVQSLKFGGNLEKINESFFCTKQGIYKNLEIKVDYVEDAKARELLQLFFKKKRSLKYDQ